MQVIGFNFTKIKVERNPGQLQPSTINTNIEFVDMAQENILRDLMVKLFPDSLLEP